MKRVKTNPQSAFTFLEIMLVISILAVITCSAWLSLTTKFLDGRSTEAVAENLVNFIRIAQLSAKETESCQMIQFTKTSAIWQRYPGKTKAEIKDKLWEEEGEVIRSQKFKNEVKIKSFELEGEPIEVPKEKIEDIGILIDEKGNADESTIVLARGEEKSIVSVAGKTVRVGIATEEIVELNPENPEMPKIYNEVFVIQTEPINARGWQVINVHNVDKVQEVRLRVKLDSKLPTRAHIHIYVFPGWYEDRPVVHGVTEEQTLLKMGTVPSLSTRFARDNSHCHFSCASLVKMTYSLYRESTDDCLAFFQGGYMFSGKVMYGTSQPAGSGHKIAIKYKTKLIGGLHYTTLTTDSNGYYEWRKKGPLLAYMSKYAGSKPASPPYYIHDYLTAPNQPPAFIKENFYLGGENSTLPIIPPSTDEGNPFSNDRPSIGKWGYSESTLLNSAMLANVPVFSTQALSYYIYKNEVIPIESTMQFYSGNQTLPMFDRAAPSLSGYDIKGVTLYTGMTSNNALNSGGFSDFSTENASLVFDTQYTTNAHWVNGYVYSSFASGVTASQQVHSIEESAKEIKQTEWSSWLTIPVGSLPIQTEFLRIAIALYHEENGEEYIFNSYPSCSSTHSDESTFVDSIDYETDPFIVHYPWASFGNDPFWLSNYAHALKPIVRPYEVNILAAKGPVVGEKYMNTDYPYQGFWYGPLYLDWDLILGDESLYELLGWVSSAFELSNKRWRYSQSGDTYGRTSYAPPSHYLLKNFAYLSYWYLFQHTVYSEEPDYNLSLQEGSHFLQDGSQPRRFQEPLNLSRTVVPPAEGSWFKLFERAKPPYQNQYQNRYLDSLPYESSSLSIPLLTKPNYPIYLATIPAIFGQARLTSAPDLYSSLFYLQERINHTMLDIGIWTILTKQSERNIILVGGEIFGLGGRDSPLISRTSPTLGNFEEWSIGGDTLASWWRWYQNIPWAKGQAFPRKTGHAPTDFIERAGWERPVITQPSNYLNYFASYKTRGCYRDTGYRTYSYNVLQVVNAPHTIFMSTSHYPLGTVQMAVKK